jgi:two-component system chemotaxis response regulator CheY
MAVDLGMPILVVDDFLTMVRIIRNLLQKLGFDNVDEAADGNAALARLKEKSYGLVISDWQMAPMTGIELLRRLRADDGLRDTPFIMVTGEEGSESLLAAARAGADGTLVKPFAARALKSRIEAACAA